MIRITGTHDLNNIKKLIGFHVIFKNPYKYNNLEALAVKGLYFQKRTVVLVGLINDEGEQLNTTRLAIPRDSLINFEFILKE